MKMENKETFQKSFNYILLSVVFNTWLVKWGDPCMNKAKSSISPNDHC